MKNSNLSMLTPQPTPAAANSAWSYDSTLVGTKYYELSNHLGNVLTVFRDVINGDAQNGYTVDVSSVADYSPFGVQLDGRTQSTGDYRYGYQGSEKDDEISGEGNSLNFRFRMYDPRIGRMRSLDPLSFKFPWNSPYAFSENRVLDCIELEGAESMNIHIREYLDENGTAIQLVSWDSYTNQLGKGDNGIATYLHKIDGTTEVRYTPDVVVSGHLNKPVTPPAKKKAQSNERKWYQSGGNGPAALFGKKFANWLRGVDSKLEGNHDAANQGGWGGNKEKELKYGLTTLTAILSIGTGGGSLLLGAEGWSATFAITGIVNATDDITGLASSDGQTMIQQVLGKEVGTAVKLIGSFTTSRADLTDALNNMDDVERTTMSIISATNDQGQVVYGIIKVNSEKGKDD